MGEAIFKAMGTANLSILGVEATYQPNDGDAVSCRVWFDQEIKYQVDNHEGQVRALGYEVEAILDDLGKEPERGETFEIGSTTYTVQSSAENEGIFTRVYVK